MKFLNFFWKKKLTIKSFLNPHFNGFGAISRLRGCRSCFSVHFGPGDVPKAPTGTRFKPILTFFTIFLRWRVAAGAFFWPKIAFLWEKNIFLQLAACRRRFFFGKKWPKLFSSNWRLAAGAFFSAKIAFLKEKDNFFRLAACRRRLFFGQKWRFWKKMTFSP